MITVELKDEVVDAALARADRLLADLSPVMETIGELLLESTKKRMLAGETPEGVPFVPRSATTLARYAKTNTRFGLPLYVTGTLQRSIYPESGPDFAQIGTPAIQGAVMQFGAARGAFGLTSIGGSIPWGDIPARPFLGLSETDRTNILDTIEEELAATLE